MPAIKETFRFDPKEHRYFFGTREVPSVTAILKGAGLIDTDFMTEYGRTRGSYVHEATALFDREELNESTLAPVLLPYLNAYKAFRAELGFEPIHIERPLGADLRGFAGTVDRIGMMNGRRALIEIKTSVEYAWHKLQDAAYKTLAEINGIRVDDRYALYLRPEGDYRLKKHDSTDDEPAFFALLSAHYVRKNYGGRNGV